MDPLGDEGCMVVVAAWCGVVCCCVVCLRADQRLLSVSAAREIEKVLLAEPTLSLSLSLAQAALCNV